MRLAQNILNTILYSNLFISGCAAGLVYETYLLSGIPASLRLAAIVFFGTMFVYNIDGLLPYKFNQEELVSQRTQWVRQNRLLLQTIAMASALCAITLYYTALFELNFWFILHLLVVAGLYSVPFIPEQDRYIPLRDVPLLKVFMIAYVWTAITVQLPLMEAAHDLFSPENLFLFLRRFLFIFSLTLVFDIRDVNKDQLTGTITFPVKWGVERTKKLALLLLLLFVLSSPIGATWWQALGLALSGVAAAALIRKTHANRSQYFFLIAADGMMLVQVLLVWLFS
ncbi:UbiA prenyltransferase family protein [Rufibacter roseus]|uniref:UbiA family prenyltransferase n=1 Tax=Rufibacter roseus TaxID=1567108 RepID=A0ABW2DHX4_9BACT|nr:UbiA family prenyltransferase [Rufibacter roseus]